MCCHFSRLLRKEPYIGTLRTDMIDFVMFDRIKYRWYTYKGLCTPHTVLRVCHCLQLTEFLLKLLNFLPGV